MVLFEDGLFVGVLVGDLDGLEDGDDESGGLHAALSLSLTTVCVYVELVMSNPVPLLWARGEGKEEVCNYVKRKEEEARTKHNTHSPTSSVLENY
jgi:hypothetical protein